MPIDELPITKLALKKLRIVIPAKRKDNPAQPTTEPLSRAQRLTRVQALLNSGKSNREIAKRLKVNEGTIRRDKRILALSAAEIQVIQDGAPVEPMLQKQKKLAQDKLREQQDCEERHHSSVSTRLATVLSGWLNDFPLFKTSKVLILEHALRRSWHSFVTSERFFPVSAAASVIKSTTPKTPAPEYQPELISWLLNWLFDWLLKVEPDREIRDRAITIAFRKAQLEARPW